MSSRATTARIVLALATLAAFIGLAVPSTTHAAAIDGRSLAAAKAAMDAFQKADYVHWASFYADDAVIEDVGSGKADRTYKRPYVGSGTGRGELQSGG